ncbi:MAG TPA: DivIVA domain-containing protein [Fimbriimonas sp.]
MERILPIDLQRHNLKKSAVGYDRKSVDDLLEKAAQSLSASIDENAALHTQLGRLHEQLDRFKAEESLMREALVLAQKTADETRAAAHREADLIREAARQQAGENLQDLRRQADDLRWEIERLRLERTRFRDEFRSVLERYGRELEATPQALSVVEAQVV